ncbi:Interferon Regulatory Factor 8 [Manis pentadactyla]|nr:Interferon Regulatory Factor 8 [Manis pentadactyla]
MAEAEGSLRLRDWLVAQIESGGYAGLRWEDAGKTVFRIHWKHAAKQGYQARQDATIFRAWAIYKGKCLEGIDKQNLSTWKTRLRCALNKSADFCDVRERSQLDISNPYKVCPIVLEGACGPGPLADHRSQKQDPAHPQSPLPFECFSDPDCWLHVRLFYGVQLVGEATVRKAKGCHLCPRAATASAERLLGPPLPIAQPRACARAPHRVQPNQLERERTCQLLYTRRFLAELCAHLQDGDREPEYQICLCFGEEYPGPPDQPEEQLVMAHVEPVFARELLQPLKRHSHGSLVAGPQRSIPDDITHLLTQPSQP